MGSSPSPQFFLCNVIGSCTTLFLNAPSCKSFHFSQPNSVYSLSSLRNNMLCTSLISFYFNSTFLPFLLSNTSIISLSLTSVSPFLILYITMKILALINNSMDSQPSISDKSIIPFLLSHPSIYLIAEICPLCKSLSSLLFASPRKEMQ